VTLVATVFHCFLPRASQPSPLVNHRDGLKVFDVRRGRSGSKYVENCIDTTLGVIGFDLITNDGFAGRD
jgi:hypothetical protein